MMEKYFNQYDRVILQSSPPSSDILPPVFIGYVLVSISTIYLEAFNSNNFKKNSWAVHLLLPLVLVAQQSHSQQFPVVSNRR